MKIIILFTGLFSLSRRLVLLHLLHPLAPQGRGGDGVAGELLAGLARPGEHGGGDDSVVYTSGGVAGRKTPRPSSGTMSYRGLPRV